MQENETRPCGCTSSFRRINTQPSDRNNFQHRATSLLRMIVPIFPYLVGIQCQYQVVVLLFYTNSAVCQGILCEETSPEENPCQRYTHKALEMTALEQRPLFSEQSRYILFRCSCIKGKSALHNRKKTLLHRILLLRPKPSSLKRIFIAD